MPRGPSNSVERTPSPTTLMIRAWGAGEARHGRQPASADAMDRWTAWRQGRLKCPRLRAAPVSAFSGPLPLELRKQLGGQICLAGLMQKWSGCFDHFSRSLRAIQLPSVHHAQDQADLGGLGASRIAIKQELVRRRRMGVILLGTKLVGELQLPLLAENRVRGIVQKLAVFRRCRRQVMRGQPVDFGSGAGDAILLGRNRLRITPFRQPV